MNRGNEEMGESEIHAANIKNTNELLRLLKLYHGEPEAEAHEPEPVKIAEPPKAVKHEPQIIVTPTLDPIIWFALIEQVSQREEGTVFIDDIKRATCQYFGLPRNEVFSDRRNKQVVYPRQIAMYLAKRETSRSLPEIGRKMGGKDHTTVIHAVRKVASQIKTDWKLAFDVAHVEAML